MNENQNQLVFNPAIARGLLKKGFQIIDIKQNKYNKTKTVFVFQNTNEFKEEFENYLKNIKTKND